MEEKKCINCNDFFKSCKKSYARTSVECTLGSLNVTGRDVLEQVYQIHIEPVKKVRQTQFLCRSCWKILASLAKGMAAKAEFDKRTHIDSYLKTQIEAATNDSHLPHTANSRKRPHQDNTSDTGSEIDEPPKAAKQKKQSSKESRTKWDIIVSLIRHYQYYQVLKSFYRASPGTKRNYHKYLSFLAKKEMTRLRKKINLKNILLSLPYTLQAIDDFTWDTALKEVEDHAPVIIGALKGAILGRKCVQKLDICPDHTLVAFFGILLRIVFSRRGEFLPSLLSVQLLRDGIGSENIEVLQRLGLGMGYNNTLNVIDKLKRSVDSSAENLKKKLENYLNGWTVPYQDETLPVQNEEEENEHMIDDIEAIHDGDQSEGSENEESDCMENNELEWQTTDEETNMKYSSTNVNIDSAESNTCHTEATDTKSEPAGFTFCWDNTGKKVVTRHPTESVKKAETSVGIGYLAVNRIPSVQMNWKYDSTVLQAVDIPTKDFLPNESDRDMLRYRMQVIVGRILVRQHDWFQTHFKENSILHITHKYSLESAYKSDFHTVETFKDIHTSAEAFNMYQRFQDYMPMVKDSFYPAIVHGDGSSCRAAIDAKQRHVEDVNPKDRLEGLEPGMQEFEKEMFLVQDFFDLFFKNEKRSEKGSLSFIRNYLIYHEFNSDVTENYSLAWDLMCIAVESSVCLLMMKQGQMETKDDRPIDAPDGIETATDEEKCEYLKNVCGKIVEEIWHDVDTETVMNSTDVPFVLCCGKDLDEDMIGCEARSCCKKGEFFHYSCVGIEISKIPTPWYCSEDCMNTPPGYKLYCICQNAVGEKEKAYMVRCSGKERCTRYEWYHVECLCDFDDFVELDWYCCNACKDLSTRTKSINVVDHMYNYNIAMLWRGLNILCRRDAVNEADGEAMMSFWKFDLVYFFRRKQPKYLRLAHHLLAAVNGWLPVKLRHDLVYNRTINCVTDQWELLDPG